MGKSWIKYFIILILSIHCSSIYAKDKTKKFITHVTVTTYNPVKEQCDSDPLTTASGVKIDIKKLKAKKLRYCAVSRDLLWCLPFGSIIHIEGYGCYQVVDTMHMRFNHYVDILQHKDEKGFKKEKLKITKIQ